MSAPGEKMSQKLSRDEFFKILKKIPKAEIHLHIEAVCTLQTVKKLYKLRYGKEMTAKAAKELFTYDDLNGFIRAFLQVQDLFQSVDDFNFIFDDFSKYLVKNNIKYCEAFFAPTTFLIKGFKYKDMIAIFSKKIAEIKEKHGIIIKLLLDVSRTFGIDNAMRNYNLLKEYPCADIIGIGLGGAEMKGPAKDFSAVFELAHKDGFHAVAHAGEDVGPESVWDSINFLHAERIGHGITSIQDETLLTRLKEMQMPLEVCVTSNVFTKKIVSQISDHPIRSFFERGLFVTVNTDDPVFFKTTLIEEYWKLYDVCGFSMEEIKTLILAGFKALFIDDDKKAAYYARVEKAWKKYVGERVTT